MGVAQQLFGARADVVGHPVWNLRRETPEALSRGQDSAYLDEECWGRL